MFYLHEKNGNFVSNGYATKCDLVSDLNNRASFYDKSSPYFLRGNDLYLHTPENERHIGTVDYVAEDEVLILVLVEDGLRDHPKKQQR